MPSLFKPLKIKDIEFKNRIFVSPMCQYSAVEGVPQDWHLVHLGSRAVGGAALVIVEATAVKPEGRISPGDTGLWNQQQQNAFLKITDFIKSQNSIPGIQIAHAGRKASCFIPWKGSGQIPLDQGGWETEAPSPIPFNSNDRIPRELTISQMQDLTSQFCETAKRAEQAGFQVLEIHMAHGYLLHEFLSPISNQRKDKYGGALENRMRFPLELAAAVRKIWPMNLPLFVRISASDWMENGWTISESIAFSKKLKEIGIDLIDCSSGGTSNSAKIPAEPGYQVEFAAQIKKQSQIKTGAVGLIKTAKQANEIIESGKADAVLIGREFLNDPYWAFRAAQQLEVSMKRPNQYLRA